jgi:metallo-beta-lactamase class B
MTHKASRSLALTALATYIGLGTGFAQGSRSYTEPFEPFKIVGNLYFVGTRGVSSFLLTSPEGHILLDTGVEAAVPQVRANIEKLGFKITDVKILLSSHAHFDHVGGHAEMQRITGATAMAVGEDAVSLSSGSDISALSGPGWKRVAVGRVLRDGEDVSLGGVTLKANLTPGHTKGCTTWTTVIRDGGRSYRVVFVGGTSINQGVRLVGNTRHPTIIDDYARTFRVLKELNADIFLAQHPSMFNMEAKVARLKAGDANAFVDPEGYRTFVANAEGIYQTQLDREKSGRQ